LEGHQLIGNSSAFAYKAALLRGCRCVECTFSFLCCSLFFFIQIDNMNYLVNRLILSVVYSVDCWDNEENINEPIIYHGHTLVTKVPFREVLQTIKEFGFVASP
jgi:hypothetical protein